MVEAVQRWRIAFRRDAPALDLGPPEIVRAFETALDAAGVPVVMSAAAKPRPRLAFAAPLPPGRIAEHDLADIVLGERWPLARLRSALTATLPAGLWLVDLYDVWLHAPSLPAVLNAMSHRAVLAGTTPGQLSTAAGELLAAKRLNRTRTKGAEQRQAYDLRPLILGLEVDDLVVRMILRASSDGPSGRPDELLLALAEAAGQPLEQVQLVRERLWTADEVPILAN